MLEEGHYLHFRKNFSWGSFKNLEDAINLFQGRGGWKEHMYNFKAKSHLCLHEQWS